MPSRPTSAVPSAAHDAPPTPPVEPALEDCCGSGCDPCIFDLYQQARERYQHDLQQWQARQAGAPKRKR